MEKIGVRGVEEGDGERSEGRGGLYRARWDGREVLSQRKRGEGEEERDAAEELHRRDVLEVGAE